MTFPLQLGAQRVASPSELGALARRDCAAGGSVIAGLRVWQWVLGLVAEGTLARPLAVGLAAGLVRLPEASTIAEGARLSAALGDPALGELLLSALRNHDTALLLQTDPGFPGHSVEDALLCAVVSLCELADRGLRGEILERLRHAALRDQETAVLFRWGDEEELATWLPAVLTEGLPPVLGAEPRRTR